MLFLSIPLRLCPSWRLVVLLTNRHSFNLEFCMKIRPLHDRVVVRRKEEEEKSAGGIVLPGSAKEKPNQGVVVAVGSGKPLDNGEVRKLDVEKGDVVVFGKYAGSDTIEIEGEELVILSESDIKAIIE